MAAEGAVGTARESDFVRRWRDRLDVWRRLFLQNWNLFKASRIGVVGLAIMIAFVILALAAPFMGLRDPTRWTAPDEDLISVNSFWTYDSSQGGSELANAPPVTQPSAAAFRVESKGFDPRTNRVYFAAENRLYAMHTEPEGQVSIRNAWGTLQYFDVRDGSNPTRIISVPPITMNYGNYRDGTPDYELYVGADDGTLYFIRDTGDVVPTAVTIPLEGKITGLAAFNGDQYAPAHQGSPNSIIGHTNHLWLNGTKWMPEPVPGGLDDVGEFSSLALDSANVPYIAFYNVFDGQPHVVFRNGTAWTSMRDIEPFNTDTTLNAGQFTSLQMGSDGYPRLAYLAAFPGGLTYAAWNGTNWTRTAVDPAPGVGLYASLKLDPSNVPNIAYYNTSGRLQFAFLNGTNWTIESPDPGSPSTGQFASLALDPTTSQPRIAYYDANRTVLKYAARIAPGVWTVQVADGGPGDVGRYASLALDNTTGFPRIAYYDATRGALKYANSSGGPWSNETVDISPTANLGSYASLGLNATGVPSIAYHDAANLTLRFAQRNVSAGQWDLSTLVAGGNDGLYASLRFDGNNRPHVAYYSMITSRTRMDMLVVGTATGKLYGIDVGIPGSIHRRPDEREKQVDSWSYRVRWVKNLGSEVHLATAPLRGVVPLFSPCFTEDGTAVAVGTASGKLYANRTSDGGPRWSGPAAGGITVGQPSVPSRQWTSAPVVYHASEGPENGAEIVYAGSNIVDWNGDGRDESLLFAINATTGGPIRGWDTWDLFGAFDHLAAPVEYPPGTSDGGNLTQPFVEGGNMYFGSASGRFYALRRDLQGDQRQVSYLPPASLKWDLPYRDIPIRDQGFHERFTSAPLVLIYKELLLVTANHDNGTADPSDDHGIIYSFKLDGTLSWKKSYSAPMPGTPGAWQSPRSLDVGVWVLFGSPRLKGVQNLFVSGQFLAPSPPSWAHQYNCPSPGAPNAMCPGYPSGNQYWLGLDSQGRDIFSQVIWGSRIALLVGFLSAIFTVVLGVVVGLIAGYVGGKVESILMRFTDVILVLPGLPLIITLAAVLGASIWNIILVISLLGWPGIARIIRAEVLSLKERPFIDSARVTGASTTRIVFRHIAPNVMPLAFLYMTFSVSGAILTEAALSFIGLGDISTMSWGIMLQLVSQSKALTAWWWLLPPGLAITLISLAFFLVGRAFDEIVNPRLRKR